MPYADVAPLTVGEKIKEFVHYCDEAFVSKDERGVIDGLIEIGKLQKLYNEIQKEATDQLFSRAGERRGPRETALAEKYGFHVVCIESCNGEWLSLGIQTPTGIIPYEP